MAAFARRGVTVLLTLLAAASAAAGRQDDVSGPLAARVGAHGITLADLDRLAADRLARLRAEEYAMRRRVLDAEIDRLLLEQEAVRRGDPPASLERLAPKERQALLDILRTQTTVRVLLEPPRAVVGTSDAPARGPADAPVTIVVFSDFQCPFCRAVAATLRRVETVYAGRVRVVFRDFPLGMHPDAPKAAEAARCAGDQGRFWAMHDALFSRAGVTAADLRQHAGAIGLDLEQFAACLERGDHAAAWRADRAAGQRLGVTATPTLFVNGRLLAGAQPFEAFAAVIDDELARAAVQGRP